MKRQLLFQSLLSFIIFLNPLFLAKVLATDTYFWIGGYSNNWEDEQNWRNLDTETNGVLPVDDSDIMIDGDVTIFLSSSIITESIQLSGGAVLTVNSTGSISTTEGGLNGSNSIRLDEVTPYDKADYAAYLNPMNSGGPSALIVNGSLNLNNDNANGGGLRISAGTSVTIGATGTLAITNDGDPDDPAIKVKGGSLTNNGTITLTNPGHAGIGTSGGTGDYGIFNHGTITISGGDTGFDLGSVWVDNRETGTVIVSNIESGGKILDGSGNFRNWGIFGGDGTVEADDFIPQPGSTIAPGTSIGTLTFDDDVDFSGVTLEIEIESAVSFDQIIVDGDIILSGAEGLTVLMPIITYQVVGETDFTFLSATGSITGSFGSPMEGSVTINNTSFTISYSDANSNPFTFSVNNFQFPVELTSFTAQSIDKAVQLTWSTATETNNDYFSIEHSTDGRQFSGIGRVAGAGTSQEVNYYTFRDAFPEKGLNYYRLKQVDYDGAFEYSPVQTVFISDKKAWTIQPTLARDVVAIEWVEAPTSKVRIAIFNLAGQQVYSQDMPAYHITAQIPVQHWVAGTYLVQIYSNGNVVTQRFQKI